MKKIGNLATIIMLVLATWLVASPTHTVQAVPSFISVDIDIKPGSDPNSINPNSKGVISVAILSSADFDASEVDVTTLTFGPGGATPTHAAGGHLEDVNSDGFTDLVSHYRIRETGIAQGDTEACVTGATIGGIPFNPCDSISTVGK